MTLARALPIRPSLWRSDSLRRGALTLIVAAALYEALARSGYFPPALTPTLGDIAHTLFASLADGSMVLHAAATLYRVVLAAPLPAACRWE